MKPAYGIDYRTATPNQHRAELRRVREATRVYIESTIDRLAMPDGWRIRYEHDRTFLSRYHWIVCLFHGEIEVECLGTYQPVEVAERMKRDAMAQVGW